MASNMQGPGGRPSKLVVLYLDLPTYGLSAPKHFIFIDRTAREVFERQDWAIIILNKPFVNDYYVSYKGRSTPKEDRRGIFANPRQRPIGSLARSRNGCRSRNDFFSEVAVAPGLSFVSNPSTTTSTSHQRVSTFYFSLSLSFCHQGKYTQLHVYLSSEFSG